MGSMDRWDVVLLAVVGYVAVMALVRLMAKRRDQVFDELQKQVEAEQHRKRAEEKEERRRERAGEDHAA